MFDRKQLLIKPLRQRDNLLTAADILPFIPYRGRINPDLRSIARKFTTARTSGSSRDGAPACPPLADLPRQARRPCRVLFLGAHVVRAGVQRYLIDLMEQGYISALAMNGATAIHDYEFALIGATTESVSRYIETGEFGFWKETGRMNDIITAAGRKNLGMGHALGRHIYEENFSHRDISLLAAAFRLNIPATVHVSIGCDIIHQHPNCSGAALGATSYRDFLTLAAAIQNLSGGVFLNFGSAVTGPEVFLKAYSMAVNVSRQKQRRLENFTIGVFDIRPLAQPHKIPGKRSPLYYFRPLKNLLVRPLAKNCRSYYIRGEHRNTVRALWHAIRGIQS